MAIDTDSAAVPPEDDNDEEGSEAPRAKRPGQAGFAERLMSKYGWARGAGLGADSGGITSALRVQVEKRRRRPDAEGGGFAEPGGRGRIIGGKTKPKKDGDDGVGAFGPMSEVVVLRGMLEGMPDLVAEMEAGLAQEIGEECGERYGRVERLFIDVEDRQVFIKFTDQVSALRVSSFLLFLRKGAGRGHILSVLSSHYARDSKADKGANRPLMPLRDASSTGTPSCRGSTTRTSSRRASTSKGDG